MLHSLARSTKKPGQFGENTSDSNVELGSSQQSPHLREWQLPGPHTYKTGDRVAIASQLVATDHTGAVNLVRRHSKLCANEMEHKFAEHCTIRHTTPCVCAFLAGEAIVSERAAAFAPFRQPIRRSSGQRESR